MNGYDRDKNEWSNEDKTDVIKKGTVIRVRLFAVTMGQDNIVRCFSFFLCHLRVSVPYHLEEVPDRFPGFLLFFFVHSAVPQP